MSVAASDLLQIRPEDLENPEYVDLLRQLNETFDANPLEAYNHPLLPRVHRKQLEFHAIKCPPLGIKAAIAGNRAGKTVACVVDDIIQLVDEELIPDHLKAFKKFEPPIVIWIGAPKMDTHMKNTVPLFRKFLPKAALKEGKFGKSFRTQPPELRLSNGSVVAFKSYDMDLDAWSAAEIHRTHWDEEPNTSNSFELRTEARMRLVSTGGDEIIGMTPLLGPTSWVNSEVWERKDIDPEVAVVHMTIWDNPWNGPDVIASIEAGLTEEEKRMRLHGEFVALGGLFFEEFREDRHVVEEITPHHLKGQDIVVGLDPGRNRTGVTWTAFDKDNVALVFDEYNPHETVVSDIAAEIKRRNEYWGVEPVAYVIDPSARNTSPIDADKVESAYMREEIFCEHGQNDRAAGILEMKRRLQAMKPNGEPAPALLFTRKCPQTIGQVRSYAKDPKSKDEWAAVPQTERTRFDLCDAVRYTVMSRTWFVPPEDLASDPYGQDPYFQPPYARRTQDVAPLGPFS